MHCDFAFRFKEKRRWQGCTASRWGNPEFVEGLPWGALLPMRERSVLALVEAELGSGGCGIPDLSQGIDRKSINRAGLVDTAGHPITLAPCVTPNGRLWHTRRCRLLIGPLLTYAVRVGAGCATRRLRGSVFGFRRW